MAMKVVRQARLELSGGSTPDLLRPKKKGEHPNQEGDTFVNLNHENTWTNG